MPTSSPRQCRLALAALAMCSFAGVACSSSSSSSDDAASAVMDTTRYKAEGDEGLGVSVVIVLDNSGSMGEKAEGDKRDKAVVARQAIEQTLTATDVALAKRPDFPIKVGIVLFSDAAAVLLPVQPYDRDSVRAALGRVPEPRGGTAIGDAMDAAREDLYRAGTFRKVMLVVTDGENTNGRKPADMAREIAQRSDGGVRMYFIAFDTDAEKFGFVRDVKGDVVTAQNSASLQTSLSSLYESKVLAESATEPDASVGARAPADTAPPVPSPSAAH
ncbi:MAG: vWA domain-containing protein [Gemmatimonadaceae bacterium]